MYLRKPQVRPVLLTTLSKPLIGQGGDIPPDNAFPTFQKSHEVKVSRINTDNGRT